MNRTSTNIREVDEAMSRLERALVRRTSRYHCLRLWSQFIRIRDGKRCVDCHETKGISAHHICRKTLVPKASFLPGNGITLCRKCHSEVHENFNGRPDLSQPIDAQGGEKLDLMERLYCILSDDASERNMPARHYYLGEGFLGMLKSWQGLGRNVVFAGFDVEQAYRILATVEPALVSAILRANGIRHAR